MSTNCFCHVFGLDVCRHTPVPDVITREEKRRLATEQRDAVQPVEFREPTPFDR